jgi:IclR family KDG regulon transcriptional repressor
MGLTEVAEHTGLLKSDVHRILKSLEHFGFIEQDAHTRRYRLGLELLKLGHLVHDRLHLSDTARPFLRWLSEATEAATNLAIFDPVDEEVIFIEQIDSSSEVQIHWRIGRRVAPHATAVGKTLLAYLDPEVVRKVCEKTGLERKTRYTLTTPAELETELARIRESGYGVDREEAVMGACCIAAPVRDHKCRVVAAVSASMLAVRLGRAREREIAALVRSAAARISGELGYPGPTGTAVEPVPPVKYRRSGGTGAE